METNCISCNESILQVAKFCPKCGTQQKCKACSATVIKGANNCIECGELLSKKSEANAPNTFEFNQTLDSRSFKAAFTNEVGVNVVDAIKSMLENNQEKNKQLRLNDVPIHNPGGNVMNNETEDVPLEDVTTKENNSAKTIENNEIPHINDVEKTIDCSEADWILIYTFYISNHGKDVFNQESVHKKYKDKRYTESRIKNFSNNWKSLFKEYIKTIKDGELRLTELGINAAINLVTKKTISKPKSFAKRTSSKKTTENKEAKPKKENSAKTIKTQAKSITPEQFDVHKATNKPSLEDFLQTKKVGDDTFHRILAIAYYIQKYCKLSSFSDGNIEYAYKVLGLSKRPKHLHQTILNAKIKYLWYEKGTEADKWKLTRDGEIYVDEKLV